MVARGLRTFSPGCLCVGHFGLRGRTELLSRRLRRTSTATSAEGLLRLIPGAAAPAFAGQHFVTGADVSARWWAAFKSPPLNELVRQSVDHNPNLQAAEAAIKVAQYNALAQRGLFFPQVTGNSTPPTVPDRQSRPGAADSDDGAAIAISRS